MNEYKLFPTSLWSIKLDLDLDLLRKDIKEFVLRTPSCQKSNQGGYQGAPYDYKPLSSVIKDVKSLLLSVFHLTELAFPAKEYFVINLFNLFFSIFSPFKTRNLIL